MRNSNALWFWRSLWGISLLIGLGILVLYTWLPADGATGDLESFTPQGFRVQWLLEEREGGLQIGDVILRAGGHTVDEWLHGAPRGPEWRTGGIVPYQILRDGQVMTLPIQLAPISFRAVLDRWAIQLVTALAFFSVGTFVFWRRPNELPARLLMFLCVTQMLQIWGDAYNFQYAILPWRWLFWFHLALEQLTYGLGFAAICHFVLIFPVSHPLIERFPRLAPLALYASPSLITSVVMGLSPTWSEALEMGNRAVVLMSIVQIGLSVVVSIRSARNARDPVTRAQVHLLFWSAVLVLLVGGAGYILPLALTGRSLIPHPAAMLLIAFMPFVLAIAILRYNLFDIEIIINLTLVYGALTTSLALVYFGSVALLQKVFRALTGQESNAAIVVSTLAIAALFQPLRRHLQAFIDRRFYREKVDFRQAFTHFSREVRTIIELPELLRVLLNRVTDLLHIAHCAVFLRSANGTFELAEARNLPQCEMAHLPLTQAMLDQLQSIAAVSRPQDKTFPLLVPLVAPRVGGERMSQPLLVGVLALGPRLSGQRYSHEDQTLLIGLADQAGTAIHVAQLHEEQQAEVQRRKEAEARRHLAETLRALTVTLSSTLDLTEILERLLEGLAQTIPHASSAVMLIQGDYLQVMATRGIADPEAIHRLHIPVASDELFAEIVHTGQPILIADAQRDPRFKRYGDTGYVRGWVGVPLISKGEVIGMLTVDSRTPNAFGKQEAEIALTFANQAAIAIENARLYGDVQARARELTQRARRLRLVSEMSVAINQSMDLDAVLQTAVTGLARVLEDVDVSQIGLALFDETREYLTVVAECASPGGVPAVGTRIPEDGNPSMERILATKAPLAIADAQNDPLVSPIREIMIQRRIQSILLTPLIVRNEVIGTLGCDAIGTPHTFTQEEIELTQTVANLVAARIEQARLLDTERRRAEELDVLRATIADISSELELSKLLQAILVRAVALLDATGGDLGLYDETRKELLVVSSYNLGKDYTGTRMAEGEGVMGCVAATGEPLIIQDYNVWEGRSRQYADGKWYAVMAAPLTIGGRLVGVIGVVDADPTHQFTASNLRLLNLFAQQAAIAIENAGAFGEVQRLAITDGLTGISNRRHLFALGEREFNRARRFDRPLSAIMLDIDHFKQVNDTYGHAVGDQVLCSVAKCCLIGIRDIDIVGRYGGEEFGILLPETAGHDAYNTAERLRQTIAETPTKTKRGSIAVTISLGVAEVTEDTPDLVSLFDHADQALYAAKQGGRNRVCVW